jgi:hypothetical protein
VEGVTLSGAAVRLEGSGRYLSNVQTLRNNEIVAGSYVVLARVGRGRWVILGVMEAQGKRTVTTDTDTILAAPANLSGTDLTTGVARLEWDASVFDIRYWHLQIGTASTGEESDFDFVLTDNSQYFYDAADNSYFMRARAVGANWKTSSWTGWISFQVTSTGGSITLDHGSLSGRGDDDHTIYVLADGTRDLAYTPGTASDWPAGDPGDTDDALDKLAERAKDLEDAVIDAADVTYTPGAASDWHGHASEITAVDDALDHLAEPHWRSWDVTATIVKLPGSGAPAEDNIDGFPVLRFDRDTEESVYFSWSVPAEFAAGAASVRGHFHFVVTHPPSGGGDEAVVMGFEYKKISPGDVVSFTSGTSSGTITETIADGETASILHTTAEGYCVTTGWEENDLILFRLYRDATNVADTYDNEAVGANNDVWLFEAHMDFLAIN